MDNLKDGPVGAPLPPSFLPPPPAATKISAAPDTGALVTDHNKGTAVTAGLRKITSDMQTHKNPNLREGSKPVVKQSYNQNKLKSFLVYDFFYCLQTHKNPNLREGSNLIELFLTICIDFL